MNIDNTFTQTRGMAHKQSTQRRIEFDEFGRDIQTERAAAAKFKHRMRANGRPIQCQLMEIAPKRRS